MVKLEIERRFLLKYVPKINFSNELVILQYYGKDESGKFRIRNQSKLREPGKSECFLTRKKMISPGVFEEDETQISATDFGDLFKKTKSKIHKVRHILERGGLKFEVDVFQEISLIILEVELPSIDHKFSFPDEFKMGENLIKEVTGDKSFSNRSLSLSKISYETI